MFYWRNNCRKLNEFLLSQFICNPITCGTKRTNAQIQHGFLLYWEAKQHRKRSKNKQQKMLGKIVNLHFAWISNHSPRTHEENELRMAQRPLSRREVEMKQTTTPFSHFRQ